MTDFQEVDVAARRKAIWTLAIAAVAGSGILWLAQDQQEFIGQWLSDNLDWLLENPWVPVAFLYMPVLPAVAGCAYFYHFGNRILRSQRFPPNGVAVTRRTRILRGPAAVRRARLLQLLSLLLMLAMLAIPVVIYRVLVGVLATP